FGKTPSLYGRGAAHAEIPLGSWHLTGELELRDQDLADIQAATGAQALIGLRQPQRLERALDPERFPTEWADDSAGIVPNPGQARLRLELSHSIWGRLGVGTHRAEIADGEVGRYQRELFGPFLDLHTPAGTFQVAAKAFAAPGWIDPVDGIALVPSHEELWATGGSVYYLGHQDVAEGSEVVRVEVRDGLGGVPLAERHLVRGRDYEIDYRMGRVLLARPLSFVGGTAVLGADPLTSSPQNVLVVEYEHDQFGAVGRPLGGGELSGTLGPVKLSAGGVDEAGPDPYLLLRGRGSVSLGLFELMGEYAHSKGLAIQPGDFSVSDDGGLGFLHPSALSGPSAASGDAWSVRLKGPGFGEGGFIDASYRSRSAGFSDSAHQDAMDAHQGSVRVQQQFGPVVVNGLFDDRLGADPRDPFGTHFVAARTVGGSVGYRTANWELRLEGRDGQLAASQDPTNPSLPTLSGGRTSVGLFGRYRLTPWLALIASHSQVLAQRGSGPGAYDSTF
ncbi:MAG TPA: flagellar motor protein, partial [Myxococcaceae bacterium]|nr:flagellar motor protein [Myxococcaceae bacterium]